MSIDFHFTLALENKTESIIAFEILRKIYICYLPDGRSVLEKYFVEVSKTGPKAGAEGRARGRRPRDVFETETKYFSVRTDLNGK